MYISQHRQTIKICKLILQVSRIIYTNVSQTFNAEFLQTNIVLDPSRHFLDVDILIKKALNAPHLRTVLEGYFKNRMSFKLNKMFPICTIKRYQLTHPVVAIVLKKFEELSNLKRCCPIPAGKYYLNRLGFTQADTPFLASFAGTNVTWILAVTTYDKIPEIGLVNIGHFILQAYFSN